MTIETTLCRVLEIRFIDARALTTEAKVNLNIDGYASRKQEHEIIKEAIRIFIDRPEQDQQEMKVLREKFDKVVDAIYKDGSRGAEESDLSSSVGGDDEVLVGLKQRSISFVQTSSAEDATCTSTMSDMASIDSTAAAAAASLGHQRRRGTGIFRFKRSTRL